jgi:hypothetical protein
VHPGTRGSLISEAELTLITQGGGATFLGATSFLLEVVFVVVTDLTCVSEAHTKTEPPVIEEPTLIEPVALVEVQAASAATGTNKTEAAKVMTLVKTLMARK